MAHLDEEGELSPLLQPRLVRMLKNRPRAINFGFREEMLEELEETIVQRRTTDTVAERVTHSLMETARKSGEPVVRGKMRDKLEKANQSALSNL